MAATHFDYRPENMQAAYQAFKKAYPGFESTRSAVHQNKITHDIFYTVLTQRRVRLGSEGF